MKIVKSELKKVVEEELDSYLREQSGGSVYILWDVTRYGGSVADRRMIGIFDSQEEAEETIDLIVKTPQVKKFSGLEIQAVRMNQPDYRALKFARSRVTRDTIRRRQKRRDASKET